MQIDFTKKLPTVMIVADTKKGRKIINRSDFDPKKHKIFEGEIPDDEPDDEPETMRQITEEDGSVTTEKDLVTANKKVLSNFLTRHGIGFAEDASVKDLRALAVKEVLTEEVPA